MDPHPTPEHRLTARLLVVAQVVLFVAVAVAAWSQGPSGWPWVGWAIALAGAGLGVWAGASLGPGLTASPIPNGRADLRRSGPYAFARHPIYTAVLVVGLGAVVWSGGWATLIAWLLLAGLLWAKSTWEEERLRERFPEYEAYAAATPRFVGIPRRVR